MVQPDRAKSLLISNVEEAAAQQSATFCDEKHKIIGVASGPTDVDLKSIFEMDLRIEQLIGRDPRDNELVIVYDTGEIEITPLGNK